MKRKWLAIVVALAVLSFAGAAYAQETLAPDQPSTGTGDGIMRPPEHKGGPGPIMHLMRGAVRGTFIVESDDGFKTMRIDRGEIAEASKDMVVINEKDGKKVTIKIDGDTKIIGKTLEELKTGDKIQALRVKGENDKYKTKAIVVFNENGRSPGMMGPKRQGQNQTRPMMEEGIF